MRELPCKEEEFLKDVSAHAMTVLRDDGVHRHIRFKRPGDSAFWFDVISWPGSLCIDGDMGTYVFRRLDDMFEFFRTDRRDAHKLGINPGYWGEKLQATARHGGYRKFCPELACEAIKSRFDDWVESEEPTEDAKAKIWAAIEEDVLSCKDDDPHNFMDAIHFFNLDGFEFTDFWEVQTEDFTYHFIWCCYAIAWGVKTYDEAKDAKGVL